MMMGSILIAEDHAPTRYLRARVLTEAGYSILESGCAATTVGAIKDGGPAIGLVLLDVGLPDGNGFDVCSQIKTTRPHLPVVLISAVYRSPHARRDGLGAGADAYIVDPTPPARLVKLIQALTAPEQACGSPESRACHDAARDHRLGRREGGGPAERRGPRAAGPRPARVLQWGSRACAGRDGLRCGWSGLRSGGVAASA